MTRHWRAAAVIVMVGLAFCQNASAIAETPILPAEGFDAAALTPGRHQFYFDAGSRSTGQPILVPVLVLKGGKAGKQLLLTAAVHGDELNGIRVIHRLADEIDTKELAGTIIAVPGVNQPGMEVDSRYFGRFGRDPNRAFPGQDKGGDTAARYVNRLWQGLLFPGTDIAVDLHTQTTGTAYPLFVFADFRNLAAKSMAFELMPEMIKNDEGEAGTLETSFIQIGVPAVTFEIGAPKLFQSDLVERAVKGLKNLLVANSFLPGKLQKPKKAPIIGSAYTNVYADEGGFAVLAVALKEPVKKGQHVATMFDAFGGELRKYHAPHDGWVLAVATDPMCEAGTMLVRILH